MQHEHSLTELSRSAPHGYYDARFVSAEWVVRHTKKEKLKERKLVLKYKIVGKGMTGCIAYKSIYLVWNHREQAEAKEQFDFCFIAEDIDPPPDIEASALNAHLGRQLVRLRIQNISGRILHVERVYRRRDNLTPE